MRNLQNLRAQIHDYLSFLMDAVAADLDSDFPFFLTRICILVIRMQLELSSVNKCQI
jgi:hypothetical protein